MMYAYTIKVFGSEDVYHLYRGDIGLNDYQAVRTGAKIGVDGTVSIVTPPALPSITSPTLTYGEDVVNLDLGESSSLTYTLSGLPLGITNETSFTPDGIPGLLAWYDAEANGSLSMHQTRSFDRNDSVCPR